MCEHSQQRREHMQQSWSLSRHDAMLKCRNPHSLISRLLPATLHFVNGFYHLKVVFVRYIKGFMSWLSLDLPYVSYEPPENLFLFVPRQPAFFLHPSFL